MKQKNTRIKVCCSRAVALEMCRYDSSKIVGETLRDGNERFLIGTVPQMREIGMTDEEIQRHRDSFEICDFIIEGNHHTVARWASFGVRVTEVEND